MRVVAVGGRAFVTGFRLAGLEGEVAENSSEALNMVNRLIQNPDVGMIVLADNLAQAIRNQLNDIRSSRPSPIIYEVTNPGSQAHKMEYREILRQILGI